MVIFTDSKLCDKIKEIRDVYAKMTKYIVREVVELEAYKYIEKIKENIILYNPARYDSTCAESHMLCCSKFNFVLEAIDLDPFKTSLYGWIDEDVGEKFSKISRDYNPNMLLKILRMNTDKFHIQAMNVADKKFINEDNLREYYQGYRWVVCGCFFITDKNTGINVLRSLNDVFIRTTELGYGDGEEMLYLKVLETHKADIECSYGDYHDILNNFLAQTTDIHYVYNVIVSGYFKMGYYEECVKCCNRLLCAYENYDVPMDYYWYYNILYEKYYAMSYINGQKHEDLKHSMFLMLENNPDLKQYYLQRPFY
jgi:pentatricopeptide repeat protein